MPLLAHARIFIPVLVTGVFLAIVNPAVAANADNEEPGGTTSSYELGRGLRLGESGFTLGGYASAQYQDLKNSDLRASLSHLSMFLWWESESRLKFFSEVDSEDTFATSYHSEAGERHYLALERLYFDYAFSDSLTLRAGKFLTPIGRWNLIHADPLVWTTSRPLITRNLFPVNATGLMALGNFPMLGRQADYTVYASLGHELRADPAQDPFNEAYGARFNLSASENMQVGLSYAIFAQRALREEHKQLLGLDFLWSARGYELTGEAAYRMSNEGAQRDAKGGFIQGVAPLFDRLYAVGRIEAIRQPDIFNITRIWLLGLNYRYSRAISLKLEFVHGTNNDISAPSGFLSSISVLF
jgi:hypothetical protein